MPLSSMGGLARGEGGSDRSPPAAFPHAWREGLGLGEFQAGAVRGLELTAASEKTCLFSQKNALQVFSKNSTCWDFPV